MLLIISLYAQSFFNFDLTGAFEEMEKMMDHFQQRMEQSFDLVSEGRLINSYSEIESVEDEESVTYKIEDRGGDTDINVSDDYVLSVKQSAGGERSRSLVNYSTTIPTYLDIKDYKIDKSGDKITIRFKKKLDNII